MNDSTAKTNDKLDNEHFIIGFIIYFIVIIMVIPIILYKNKYYAFLSCYMPNVDLIANVLTWWQGPDDIFKDLYLQVPVSNLSLFSQIFINYIALLGLTFIVIHSSKIYNNIFVGWGMAIVMILMTYLLPSKLVNYFMKKININSKGVVAIFGSIITLFIIFIEYTILKNYRFSIAKFAKALIGIPKETL
jgi:hypothetical protein